MKGMDFLYSVRESKKEYNLIRTFLVIQAVTQIPHHGVRVVTVQVLNHKKLTAA
jgi:hypothetical protein